MSAEKPQPEPSLIELAFVSGSYRTEIRQINGKWWVFLIASLGHLSIQLPMAHFPEEGLAKEYADRASEVVIAVLSENNEDQDTQERT